MDRAFPEGFLWGAATAAHQIEGNNVNHFTHPNWFVDAGGWLGKDAHDLFARYVERASSILDGVDWVCTINEPNVLALNLGALRRVAAGEAVRHTREIVGEVPIVVTENGIATPDDERRIAYTSEALGHLHAAMDDGADVRGYLHWSLLDNFEWGRWEPTFGLVAVDRETFERHPKPSLAWLGSVARANGL